MALPTADDFKARFSVVQITDDKIEAYIIDAGNDVKRKLGVEAYAEIFDGETATIKDSEYLDENVTTTDEEALRLADVTRAVIYYAAAYLVLNTHIRLAPGGQMKKQQDAGSVAMGGASQTENEYFSIKEVNETVTSLR